jgi:hypothetical protein
MIIGALRNMKPASLDERRENARKSRESVAAYKQAAKDIHDICAAKGLTEPTLTA